MPSMWERRLLTALIGVPLTLGLAMLDVQGLAAFAGLCGVIFVSLFAGIMAEPWLQARRHRTQS
jgi:hypothetical protein